MTRTHSLGSLIRTWRTLNRPLRPSLRADRWTRHGRRAIAMGASSLLIGGALVASGVATATPAVAAMNDPISCGQVYALDQSPDASGQHAIYTMNTATGALTRNNVVTYPGSNNGLAVDGEAGLFWLSAQAQGQTTGYVTSVAAATGVVSNYPVTLPGLPVTSGGVVMGAFNAANDIYYFGAVAGSTLYIYGFNRTTNTQISGIVARVPLGAGNNGDFAFDSAGRLYIVSAGLLLSVNETIPTSGTATGPLLTTTSIASPPSGSLGSMAFGGDGLLYLAGIPDGGTQRVRYAVNPSTGATISAVTMTPTSNTIGDFGSCASPNVVRVMKDLPGGRVVAGDQFTLSVTGGAVSQGNTGTTEGSDAGVQANPAEVAGPVIGSPGQTYTITEAGSNGAFLSNYNSTWTCFDSVSGRQIAQGSGPSGTFVMPDNGFAGSDVLCTFSNASTPPDLTITKSSDVSTDARPGDVVTYTVTATNTGTGAYTAENPAVVFDDLSNVIDDGTYGDDAATTRPGTLSYSSPLLSWRGALGVGASVSLTYSVKLGSSGNGAVRNVAWQPNDPNTPVAPACDPADASGNDPVTGEACAAVTFLLPRLTLEKTADRTELPAVGETVQYTVIVRNAGPGEYTATAPARATDDLSNVLDAADYNDDAAASTGTVTVTDGQLSWSGALAAGAEATITYSVTYTGTGDKNLRNLACVPAPDAAPGSAACDFVQIPGAGLTQWKQVQASATPTVAGTILTYTLFFKNDGSAAATIDATDHLIHVLDDADIASEPTSTALTAVRTGDQIAITGTVAPGATSTVTYQVVVRADGQRGDSVATNFLLKTGETPPTDPDCEPADPQLPNCTSTPITGITHAKSVTASATPVQSGTELTYTITITNTGATSATVNRDDDLSEVLDDASLVRDPESDSASVTLDDPTDGILELRGTLAAGTTATVTYTVTVNPTGERGNSQADNFLVPPGTTPPTECDPATEQCTTTPIGGYTVSKVASVPTVTPGGVVTYSVTVTNTGSVAYTDASPATFTDDLSEVLDDASYNGDVSAGGSITGDTLSWSGALEVGATVTVTYSVTVDDPTTGDDALKNRVTPTGPGGDCDPDATCVTNTPVSSFTVAKAASADTAMPGSVITYTITVTNTGAVAYTDAAPASFTDDLSAVLDDATFNDDASAGASFTGTTLTWSGPVSIGESVEVTYSVTVNDPITGDQNLTNTVVPDAPGGSCGEGDCGTTTPVASFTVGKTSSAATALPGDTVTYTVTVTNTSAVPYTDTDPASFRDDLSAVLDDAVYNDDATNGAAVAGTTLTWSGPLAAGASVDITYSVTVDKPVTGDFVLRNIVTPTGPGGSCATVCETTTPISSLRVEKSTDATGVLPGAVVDYSITVTNTGQVDYTDTQPASFTDDLSQVLDDATYNGDAVSTSGAGVSYDAPTLTWAGPLAVGASITVTYSVIVNDPATGDRRLENAVVTPPGVGGNCEPGSTDPACIANVPSGSFTVAKSAQPGSALPGDVVTYTVTVTNTGEVPFTTDQPAAFTDDLSRVLDDAAYNDDVSQGGAVDGTTLTWSGPLSVGEVRQVIYSVTVDDPVAGDFSLRNVVAPSSPGGECVEGQCITDTPIASYTVLKQANGEDVVLGGTVDYSVTVINTGQVGYTDDQPASFTDDLSAVLDDASYNGDATSGAIVDGDTLSWNGPLAVGESVTITYSVTVNAPATGDGHLRNVVVPDGPGGGCVTSDGCITDTPVASYRVQKTASTDRAVVGDTVTFTITVTNTGRVAYTAERPASFTDDLSSTLAIASFNDDATGSAVYQRPMLSWAGALAPGETTTITYTVKIREQGEILNVVVTPDGSGANCPTGSTDPDCRTRTSIVPPGLASTGLAFWATGTLAAVALLLVGYGLIRRRNGGLGDTEASEPA
ncbi:DUF11 domain-containing protein [Plantibacter sp. VKM Ac-2885]|uniref:DUF7927 domain-containing protein n=1 Tax=Plantibacter sp. VKM Ac-2885 TaxID=2783828 RepID=UPI00188B787B|nr:DUF11 domain-containing protein [Plantibacter sp. VKM Ac-2885]MBF4513570.1 DUF11 domain-containing protein [Plantibacter sp. VKM Ac-2885]